MTIQQRSKDKHSITQVWPGQRFIDFSPRRQFAPWTFRPMHGHFAQWAIRSMNVLPHTRHFALWTIR